MRLIPVCAILNTSVRHRTWARLNNVVRLEVEAVILLISPQRGQKLPQSVNRPGARMLSFVLYRTVTSSMLVSVVSQFPRPRVNN